MGDGYPTGRWECPRKLLPEVYLSCMALPPPDLQACLVSSVGPNHDPCTTVKLLLGYSKATRTTVGIICIGYKLCFRLMRIVCVHVLFVLKECRKDCWGKWKFGWLPLTDLAMDSVMATQHRLGRQLHTTLQKLLTFWSLETNSTFLGTPVEVHSVGQLHVTSQRESLALQCGLLLALTGGR